MYLLCNTTFTYINYTYLHIFLIYLCNDKNRNRKTLTFLNIYIKILFRIPIFWINNIFYIINIKLEFSKKIIT